MNKKDAVSWTVEQGWTKADAERAFQLAGFGFPQEEDAIKAALIKFAGPELKKRQGLQAAQKGQVTKKKNEIIMMAHEHGEQIETREKKYQEERSFWHNLLKTCYEKARLIGFRDPQLEKYLYGEEQDAA